MRYSTIFTNGVIKSREKFLLGDKISRLADSSAEEAFGILKESGFGLDAHADDISDAEKMVRAEETLVNDFIKEYAPDGKTQAFLLAEYDFHNAQAAVRCKYAGADESKIYAPEGVLSVDALKAAVDKSDYTALPKEMGEAIAEAAALFEEGKASGVDIDCAFKRKEYEYMLKNAASRPLRSILSASADAANVSTALRGRDEKLAEKCFLKGGKLSLDKIKTLCAASFQEIEEGDFPEDVKIAARAAAKGKPLTEFEKNTDDFALVLMNKTRYDMRGSEQFITYIMRRRAEIRNVRIIAVSLAAGIPNAKIKSKIRIY